MNPRRCGRAAAVAHPCSTPSRPAAPDYRPRPAGDQARGAIVFDIIAADEHRREMYYTASSVAGDGDPYHRLLYCASLDGGAPVLLTSAGEDHLIPTIGDSAYALYFGRPVSTPAISPDFDYFVDFASTVDKPPVTSIRSTRDGRETAQTGGCERPRNSDQVGVMEIQK